MCHLCNHTRDPRRGLNILNIICSSVVGYHFYGGHSGCFQKSIPGKVSCVYKRCVTCVLKHPLFSQTCPLDLYTDCFYENRKEAIECRVQLLSEAPVETLRNMLEDVWASQEGKVCSLVSWEHFSSLQQAQVYLQQLSHRLL